MGHVISNEVVFVDPQKTKVVTKWLRPKNPTEVRSFSGLAGYYHTFIQNFSKITITLTNTTKKATKYEWIE